MKIETTMTCTQATVETYGEAHVYLVSRRESEYENVLDEYASVNCLPQITPQMLGKTFRVTVEAIGDDA